MSTANCIDRLAPNSPGLAPWVHCLWEKRAAMAQRTTHSKPVSTYISLYPSKGFDGSATDCRAARLDAVLITTKVLQPYRPGHLPSSLRVALLHTSNTPTHRIAAGAYTTQFNLAGGHRYLRFRHEKWVGNTSFIPRQLGLAYFVASALRANCKCKRLYSGLRLLAHICVNGNH